MRDLTELLVDIAERIRRRPGSYWLLRATLLGFGVLAQAWIGLLWQTPSGGPNLWTLLGWAAVAFGAVFARSIVPLLTAALFVFQAGAAQLAPLAMVPLAVCLLGWHLCAALLSMSLPWTRRSRRIVRAFALPTAASLGAIVLAAAAASAVGGLSLPEAGVVTLMLVLVVLLGGIVVLWPEETEASR